MQHGSHVVILRLKESPRGLLNLSTELFHLPMNLGGEWFAAMCQGLTSRGRSPPGLLPLANLRFEGSRLLPAVSSESDVATTPKGTQTGNSSPTRAMSFAQAIREVSWEGGLSHESQQSAAASPPAA